MRQRDDITLPDAIDGLKDAYISLRNIKNDISIVMSRIEEIIYDDEENDEEDKYIEKTNYHIDYGVRVDESKFYITKDSFYARMQEVDIASAVDNVNTEVEGFQFLIDDILYGVTLRDNKYPDYMLKPNYVWWPEELIDSETNTWVWVIRKLIS
jgi:hypothetical protein